MTGVVRSVFFIPSNRDASRAIRSYAGEVAHAAAARNCTIPLVVVETDDGAHVAANAAAIADARALYPGITAVHLTRDLQLPYLSAVLDHEPPALRDLFLSPARNYGTAMNKLFLLTVSLGAEAFHRRDSDTWLLFDENPAAPRRYPIDLELDHLAKRVGDVTHPWYTGVPSSMNDREIWVVGGNYVGEWSLDVKDLARDSYAPIHHLYEILGFTPDAVAEFCAEAFPAEPDFEPHDEISLVKSVNDPRNSDCGNIAIYRLHELMPTIPGRNMLGASYFVLDAATALGMPSVHHTVPVFHRYNEARFQPDEKLRYWQAVARFADYFSTHAPIITNDLAGPMQLGGPVTITPEVVSRMRAMLPGIRSADPDGRVARIARIAEEVLIPFDDRYAAIGRSLISDADRLVRESTEDYAVYDMLVDRWPDLVARARTVTLDARALSRGGHGRAFGPERRQQPSGLAPN